MPEFHQARCLWTVERLAAAIGLASGLAVLLTLTDPGITIDEPLDVRPGRNYVATLRAQGSHFFSPQVVDAVFRDNAEHPPLGRWLLGVASTVGEPFEVVIMGGPDPVGLYLHAGRLAPAAAFAVLVGVVVFSAGRRYGRSAGAAAGFALVAMPRVFAHAHLGALDTFLCLFWTAALLAAERALERPRPIIAMAGAGIIWGLALLTKIHAWFLVPILVCRSLAQLRMSRAAAALAAWGATGMIVFFLGWPWLWYHSLERIKAYWGTGVTRAAIHVLYFGRVYADRDVPWHYPWFYFAVTVPIGLHVFGLLGLYRGWRDRRSDPLPLLLAGSIATFLVVFSTNIPVYDGERLFLLVFPLWAILIGRGFAFAWQQAGSRAAYCFALSITLFAQCYGVIAIHPFGLSYYNVMVGGLPGAERLGLELTYWNDPIDGALLERLVREVQPGESVALAPSLYPGQGIASTTRAMARRGIILHDEDFAARADYLVISRRTAYWKPELRARLLRAQPLERRSRQGVWLSGIWKLR